MIATVAERLLFYENEKSGRVNRVGKSVSKTLQERMKFLILENGKRRESEEQQDNSVEMMSREKKEFNPKDSTPSCSRNNKRRKDELLSIIGVPTTRLD